MTNHVNNAYGKLAPNTLQNKNIKEIMRYTGVHRTSPLWGNRPLHHEASGGHERTEEQDIRSILAEMNKKLGKLESLG